MANPGDREAHEDLMVRYVLGDLDPDEARAFKQFLVGHPEWGEEANSLRKTLDLMSYATAVGPPWYLRDTVLQSAQAGKRRGLVSTLSSIPWRKIVGTMLPCCSSLWGWTIIACGGN